MTAEQIINKAIEEADLVFINGDLTKPFKIENGEVYYMNLSTGEDEFISLDGAGVESYEG